jgi:hypothetical protein
VCRYVMCTCLCRWASSGPRRDSWRRLSTSCWSRHVRTASGCVCDVVSTRPLPLRPSHSCRLARWTHHPLYPITRPIPSSCYTTRRRSRALQWRCAPRSSTRLWALTASCRCLMHTSIRCSLPMLHLLRPFWLCLSVLLTVQVHATGGVRHRAVLLPGLLREPLDLPGHRGHQPRLLSGTDCPLSAATALLSLILLRSYYVGTWHRCWATSSCC